ncbi:MAG: hypothetical protein ACOC2L_01840 [Candidatus Sumerlaeota bacterium]
MQDHRRGKKGETNKIEAVTEAKVKVINREMEAALVTMKAETDRRVAEIKATADLSAAQIEADVKLYEAEKLAAGDLLEQSADPPIWSPSRRSKP